MNDRRTMVREAAPQSVLMRLSKIIVDPAKDRRGSHPDLQVCQNSIPRVDEWAAVVRAMAACPSCSLYWAPCVRQ